MLLVARKIISRSLRQSKSARDTSSQLKGHISLVWQPRRPARPYDNRPLNAIFFVWSIDTNVFSLNFNQEIMKSVVGAYRRKGLLQGNSYN